MEIAFRGKAGFNPIRSIRVLFGKYVGVVARKIDSLNTFVLTTPERYREEHSEDGYRQMQNNKGCGKSGGSNGDSNGPTTGKLHEKELETER